MFSNTRDVTDFVAEFRNQKDLQSAIESNQVVIPEGWTQDLANFCVIEDRGRELEIAFWNYDTDNQVGEVTMVVDYDVVMCWA